MNVTNKFAAHITMLKHLSFSTRACSSTPNWELLIAKSKSYTPNEDELEVFRFARPWANADRIKVDAVRKNILIRWPEKDERNLNILLDDFSGNFYTRHVKAVFYALAWSIHYKSRHIIVESANETVCKVSMGVNRANKEARIFDGIKKLTLADDLDEETFCKAKVIYSTFPVPKESLDVYRSIETISEDEFRKAHSKNINWMLH